MVIPIAIGTKDILQIVQENDLILRDKGYWSLDVFDAIHQKKCYFISRLKYGVNLYNRVTNERLCLKKLLRKAKNNNLSHIDKLIIIGAKNQLNVRLIAIRLPQDIANERRRKAKRNRHSKTNHSDEFYERLVPIAIGRCIFITNIPAEVLSAEQVAKVYRLRWRIEIIFNPDSYRDWKSKFDFDKIFKKKSMKPSRAVITPR